VARRKKVVKARAKVSTAGLLMRQARTALSWSQEDLSHYSGMSKAGIAKQERGDRLLLRKPYARALADAFTKGGFPLSEKQLLGQ
jgi:transcriptional regulator with XRE-family HTH domain